VSFKLHDDILAYTDSLVRCARCRDVSPLCSRYDDFYILTDGDRPLNASELNVLKAQYEREGEMVGIQTKFNYAWVTLLPLDI
jgi:hypothetical protein